jgi:hypothetical protein
MYRVAQTQFVIVQQFAAVSVKHDILRRGKQRQQCAKQHDAAQLSLRREAAHHRDYRKQTDLSQHHPAAPSAKHWQRIAVQQRRPDELPGVGKLDQRKQADGFKIDMLAAQPGRQQIEQQIQRQAGGKAGEHADQHAPGKQLPEYAHIPR